MKKVYSDSFKNEVCLEAQGAASKESVRKKHKLPSATFYSWLKKRRTPNGKSVGAAVIRVLSKDDDKPHTNGVSKPKTPDKAKTKPKPAPPKKPPKPAPTADVPTKDDLIAKVPEKTWAVTYVDPYKTEIIETFADEQSALDRAATLSTMGIGYVRLWTRVSFETFITGRRL